MLQYYPVVCSRTHALSISGYDAERFARDDIRYVPKILAIGTFHTFLLPPQYTFLLPKKGPEKSVRFLLLVPTGTCDSCTEN